MAARHRAPVQAALIQIGGSWRLPFDVIESKLQVPEVRPGTVSRTALVNRLRAAASSLRVATLVAPGGYGKTTLLAQWAARDARPFVWVTVDDRDNDPILLLRHVAAALDRHEPLPSSVVASLGSPRPSMWTTVLPRLASALASARACVLVLDDAHLIGSKDSVGALSALADHVPDGSMVVFAGRQAPRLPIARLRASGRLREIAAIDLALSRREARQLLAAAGMRFPEEELRAIIERCEGWAAALYLAALSIRDGDPVRLRERRAPFGGDERYVADYFHAEYLSRLKPRRLAFLRRTSILDTMCGPLCDAVRAEEGSARELESIERSNLFLVPLDRHREWYRYHRLFRGRLQHELESHEPELVATLHRRAADWFEAHDDPESALEHAHAYGDEDRVARLIAASALSVYDSGRIATVEGWLDRFDGESIERYPAVGVIGSWVHALRGRAEDAERWIAAAERGSFSGALPDGSSTLRPWVAVIHAALCRDGAERMVADAKGALAELPADSRWRVMALVMLGAARILRGEDAPADATLALATAAAERHGATGASIIATSQRSLLESARGNHVEAEALALHARDLVAEGRVGGYATAIQHAACARAFLRSGRWEEARAQLAAAGGLTRLLTHALPWLAVQTQVELARVHLALRDAAGARLLLADAGRILELRPDLGVLGGQVRELRDELEAIPEARGGNGMGLTAAELRLLPLLATHLSFREIGEQLTLSRNTIKTQAISAYRRLGASTRSEAIDRAVELGLVESPAPPPTAPVSLSGLSP